MITVIFNLLLMIVFLILFGLDLEAFNLLPYFGKILLVIWAANVVVVASPI